MPNQEEKFVFYCPFCRSSLLLKKDMKKQGICPKCFQTIQISNTATCSKNLSVEPYQENLSILNQTRYTFSLTGLLFFGIFWAISLWFFFIFSLTRYFWPIFLGLFFILFLQKPFFQKPIRSRFLFLIILTHFPLGIFGGLLYAAGICGVIRPVPLIFDLLCVLSALFIAVNVPFFLFFVIPASLVVFLHKYEIKKQKTLSIGILTGLIWGFCVGFASFYALEHFIRSFVIF